MLHEKNTSGLTIKVGYRDAGNDELKNLVESLVEFQTHLLMSALQDAVLDVKASNPGVVVVLHQHRNR